MALRRAGALTWGRSWVLVWRRLPGEDPSAALGGALVRAVLPGGPGALLRPPGLRRHAVSLRQRGRMSGGLYLLAEPLRQEWRAPSRCGDRRERRHGRDRRGRRFWFGRRGGPRRPRRCRRVRWRRRVRR